MNSRLKPGLQFRIRDMKANRNAGLSPHQSKGWISFVDDIHISFVIESGGFVQKTIAAKATFEQFQMLFSVIPFEPLREDIIRLRPENTLFIL